MSSIRKLLTIERSLFKDHLKRLETPDRHLRFGGAANDHFIDKYVDGIDMRTDVVFGVFPEFNKMVGAAHIAFANGVADIGLSVEKDQRGQGYGVELLRKCVNISRIRGAKKFSSQCLSHNRWMIKHVTDLGCKIERDFDTAYATSDLEPADIALIQSEIISENLNWIDYNTKMFFSILTLGKQ